MDTTNKNQDTIESESESEEQTDNVRPSEARRMRDSSAELRRPGTQPWNLFPFIVVVVVVTVLRSAFWVLRSASP